MGISSLQNKNKSGYCFVVIYATVFDRDKMESERSWTLLLRHTLLNDLLAESEGEGVCCCSDLVLCLHVGHVLCVGVADGHHPVSHPNTGLSCLSAWSQLEETKQGKIRGFHMRQ